MKTILYGWNMMRVLRIVMGSIALWQGIVTKESILGVAGVFLLFMGLANIGCCGSNGCSIPSRHKKGSGKMNP